MAFPVVASSSALQSGGSAMSPIAKPTGLAVGDLMICHINTGVAMSTVPAGWTNFLSADSGKTLLYWKIADANDVAASGFTFQNSDGSGSSYCNAIITRITGTNTTTPINISASTDFAASSAPSGASITDTTLQCLFLMFITDANTTAQRTSSGYAVVNSNPTWTEQYDTGALVSGTSRPHIALAWANQTSTAGNATGNASATLSGTSAGSIAMVAIQPPITATPTTLSGSSSVPTPTFIRIMLVSAVSAASAVGTATVSIIPKAVVNLAKSVAAAFTNLTKS